MRSFFQACGEAALAGVPADSVPAAHHDLIRRGAQRFATAIAAAREVAYQPKAMPVVASRRPARTEIGARFDQVADQMPWSPGRVDPDGTKRGIVRVNDIFDLGGVQAGLLYAGADQAYPEHNHPPQEMYIMLDGTAEWRFGGRTDYVSVPPGQTIYNNPFDTHGVRGHEPTLALWVLWAEDQ